jgi:hypothetical protein
MIVISIPVKLHVKKYLIHRYGVVHQVSKKTFIGLFLLQLLEKKIEKPEKEAGKGSFYEIEVPEFYFNAKGYSIDRNKLKFLSVCLERLFFEDFYSFVDNELCKGDLNAKKAIRLFFSIYDISENELNQDSMYRNYQRYCGEKIKHKKQNKVNL